MRIRKSIMHPNDEWKGAVTMINYSEDQGRQYHIQVAPGEVGDYVLLPGETVEEKKPAMTFEMVVG